MPGPTQLDDLIAAFRVPDVYPVLTGLAQQVVPGQTGPADTILALTWATHDLQQSMEQVVAPFAPIRRDRILGGRVAHMRLGHLDLLLEQPDTEAALAAYLSRYGEGVAAVYLERPRFMPSASPTGRPAKPLDTPVGRRGWLLPHEWPWGPFVIALEAPR